MPLTDEQQLDLVGGQRLGISFRFDLLDEHLNDVGEIDVSDSKVPTIDNDTDRAVKRQLSNVEISAADLAEVNPLRNRIRPSMVMPSGDRRSLGVFLFSGYDRRRYSWWRVPSPQFTDQGIILDQPTEQTVVAAAGAPITGWLQRWLDPLGLQYEIAENDATIGAAAAQGWPAGTSLLTPLNVVAALAGFSSAWFDNEGVLQFRPPSPIDDPSLTYTIGPSSRIIDGSIVESDSWLDAPNRYIAIDTSNTQEPLVAVFDVPDSAPNSAASIGYVRATVVEAQSAGTQAQLLKVAQRAYRQARTYEWVTFAGPPDPRHDTFQTIAYDGLNYRETGWKLPCKDGQAMEHELRRTYA